MTNELPLVVIRPAISAGPSTSRLRPAEPMENVLPDANENSLIVLSPATSKLMVSEPIVTEYVSGPLRPLIGTTPMLQLAGLL